MREPRSAPIAGQLQVYTRRRHIFDIRVDTVGRDGSKLAAHKWTRRIALLAYLPQQLLAGAGVLARDHSNVATDPLATLKPRRSSDDQHVGQSR